MHDCENCGQHTRDCRCDTPCPKCGPECDCEPDRGEGVETGEVKDSPVYLPDPVLDGPSGWGGSE